VPQTEKAAWHKTNHREPCCKKKERCAAKWKSRVMQCKKRALHCKKERGKNKKHWEKITKSRHCKQKEQHDAKQNTEPHAAKRKGTALPNKRGTWCDAKKSSTLQKRKRQKQKALRKKKPCHKQKEQHYTAQNTEHRAAERRAWCWKKKEEILNDKRIQQLQSYEMQTTTNTNFCPYNMYYYGAHLFRLALLSCITMEHNIFRLLSVVISYIVYSIYIHFILHVLMLGYSCNFFVFWL